MIPLLSALYLMIGATVTVGLAPDQPVPHVYVDDPVIVELKSDTDVVVRAAIEVTPDIGGAPVAIGLGPIALRAQGTYWTPLEGVPAERGRYHFKAHIESEPAGGGTWDGAAVFCRIDRPQPDVFPPFCAALSGSDSRSLMVLKGISVRSVRLDGEAEDLPARLQAVADMGFQVVLRLTARSVETCETLAKTAGDRVVRWDIDAGPSTDAVMTIAKGLRRGGAKSPIAVVVDGPQMLQSMLTAGAGALVNAVIHSRDWVSPADIGALCDAAESLGYEGLSFAGQLSAAASADPDVGVKIARQAILNHALFTEQPEVDTAFLYGNDFGPGYVCLSEIPRRLNGYRYLGDLAMPGVHALVFERATSTKSSPTTDFAWVTAFWADEPKDVALPVDKATGFALYDARGNTLAPPPAADGTITVQAVAEPRFLTGTGGSLTLHVVREEIRHLVASVEDGEERKAKLPAEVRDAVKPFAQVDSSNYTRMDFFNLLKMFPRMEELWQSGAIPRGVAVPVLADMARLARNLCVLEQERGEPFVEPMQNTLANCGQLQSQYLTSSSGAADTHGRADWLMENVGRLMTEAERLATDGRPMEASAVATLAEWRARALEIAAKAQPLGVPEKEIKPPEPPPAKKEEKKEEAKEEKKPADTKTDKNKKPLTKTKPVKPQRGKK